MDECIAWSTVGKNDWMDELLSRLGRGNFDIRSRLKNRELAPDQERVENLNLRCIKYYFCCWSLTVVCSHLLGKFGSKVEACAHPWNKLSELQHKQLVKLYGHLIFSIIKGPIGPSDIEETRTDTQKASRPTFCYSLQILPRSPWHDFPPFGIFASGNRSRLAGSMLKIAH